MVIGSVMPVMSISWNASLPMSAPGTLPVMATMGIGVELGGGDAGHEVGGARAGLVPRQTPTLPLRPGVAVGGVGGALLVADEDVAQLGVVVPDVVERQDHAARVAEDDIHALADERLAQRVGADARAARGLASESIALRARSISAAARRCPRWGRGGPVAGVPVPVAAASAWRRARCGGAGRRSFGHPFCGHGVCPSLCSVVGPVGRWHVPHNERPSPLPARVLGGSTFVAPRGATSACPQAPAGSR